MNVKNPNCWYEGFGFLTSGDAHTIISSRERIVQMRVHVGALWDRPTPPLRRPIGNLIIVGLPISIYDVQGHDSWTGPSRKAA